VAALSTGIRSWAADPCYIGVHRPLLFGNESALP